MVNYNSSRMVSRVSEDCPVFAETFIATMCHDLRHAACMVFILVPMCLTYKQHTAVEFSKGFRPVGHIVTHVTFVIINLCVWHVLRETKSHPSPNFVQLSVATA